MEVSPVEAAVLQVKVEEPAKSSPSPHPITQTELNTENSSLIWDSDSWLATFGPGLSLILTKGALLKSSWQLFNRGIMTISIALLRYHGHAMNCTSTDNKLSIQERQLGKS